MNTLANDNPPPAPVCILTFCDAAGRPLRSEAARHGIRVSLDVPPGLTWAEERALVERALAAELGARATAGAA